MSYKERMHPKVSKGEISLFTALSANGMTRGMVTQQTIVLRSTIPDFAWLEKKKLVYLDGIQVHNKAKVEARDEEINNMLEQAGWEVLRIPYDPPLTEEMRAKIILQIKEFVGGFDDSKS